MRRFVYVMQFNGTYDSGFESQMPRVSETLRGAAVEASKVSSGIRGFLRRLAVLRHEALELSEDRINLYRTLEARQAEAVIGELARLRSGDTRAERILVHRHGIQQL